jgi:SAM-dependent methyltransferase
MNKVRPYLPLIGFVVPTVIIGYGFVIPRSCIAGVNELSIGFGTTILGAVFTYLAGQRAVRPKVCTKPPLRVRLLRALNKQASSPSGVVGRILGAIWRREHAQLNTEVLDELDLRAGHRVLEIGPGPGEALHGASLRTRGGKVVGIDVSPVMVRLASDRNRDAVARGELEVRLGDGISLGLEAQTFDRIFSVHSIYFWRDVEGTLAQLASAIVPGGVLLLAFRPESDDIPARFRDPTYRFPRPADLEESLRRVGLEVTSSRPSSAAPHLFFVKATRQ